MTAVAPQSAAPSTAPDVGLVIAGGVTLGVGYLFSVVMAALIRGDAFTLLIPVAGGAIWPLVEAGRSSSFHSCPECTLPVAMPSLGVQTIGLILLVVGLAARTPVAASTSARPGSPTLSLAPDGAGLALAF